MEFLDVPIFAGAYDLYKLITKARPSVPKQDRHGLWQRIERTSVDVIESLFIASQRRDAKADALEQASASLNLLRLLLRLAKDTRAIDLAVYTEAQQRIDVIGRMLGGWIKSAHARPRDGTAGRRD